MDLSQIYIEAIDYLKDQFLNNEFFSGAAIATVLGSVLYSLKGIPQRIYQRIERRLVYKVVIYENNHLFDALELYLKNNHDSEYRNVEATTSDRSGDYDEGPVIKNSSSNQEDGDLSITYLQHDDMFFLWKKGVSVRKGREKLENASSLKSVFLINFELKTMFGRGVINKILDKALMEYNEQNKKRITCDVYVNRYSHWDRVKEFKKSLSNVILPGSMADDITEDLEQFKSHKKLYQDLDIPHKRGYLLYGNPGNGKTSLATAIAGHLKKNICYLNLKGVSGDDDLQQLFGSMPQNSLLAIEDIDASFNGREPRGKVTMSGLLNCMDGVFFRDGLITILTTNHIDKLDPALIRPGRVDLQIKLSNPDKQQVEEYLSIFYSKPVTLNHYDQQLSMAEVSGLCIKHNLDECLEALGNRELKSVS